MIFDIITIFPKMFDSFLNESLLKKAQDRKILRVRIHNLRDFSLDKHKSVDDKPFGGERGMVIKIEPIYRAVNKIKKGKKNKVILFSPRGKKFSQKMATDWVKLDQVIFICGRYEGVDERAAKHIADEVISIGDFVLMGGELPAMMAIEAITRLLSGVAGRSEELRQRITKEKGFLEYPQYTRPAIFSAKGKKLPVPKVLLSGDHKKIGDWRKKNSRIIE